MTCLLVLSGTPTTNPDPNSLGVSNPYPVPYVDRFTPSATWLAQEVTNSPAIIPAGSYDAGRVIPGRLFFKPSVGGASYTIGVWSWDDTYKYWFLGNFLESAKSPVGATPNTDGYYVGYPPGASHPTVLNAYSDQIMEPAFAPLWVEIKALSSGTLTVYFDNSEFILL